MQVIISAHAYRISVPRIYCHVKVNGKAQEVYYDRRESKWFYSEPKTVDIDFAALEAELVQIVYYDQLERHPQERLVSMPLEKVTMDDVAECQLHIGPKQMSELKAMIGKD